jgi:LacI family transcriptional regulator
VSNALSGKGRVSEALAFKVREAAERLAYVPSPAGRALRTGRSGVLGLVLPDISNPLFPQIAQAIEAAAADAGYGVLIGDARGDVAQQTAAINRLVRHGVDGLVIVPRRGTRISGLDRPVAVIDSPSTPGNTVAADHWQGGALIGGHLAGLGHTHVLVLGNTPTSNVQNDRIGGIRSALPRHARIETLWIEPHEAAHGAGAPLGLAERVAAGVTAIAAVSDVLALRALTELHQAGLRVPDDVSITGFDDLSWSSAISPALTTIRMDMPRIAEIAIASIVAVLDGRADANAGVVPAVGPAQVPMQLVIRRSSGPASTRISPLVSPIPADGAGRC